MKITVEQGWLRLGGIVVGEKTALQIRRLSTTLTDRFCCCLSSERTQNIPSTSTWVADGKSGLRKFIQRIFRGKFENIVYVLKWDRNFGNWISKEMYSENISLLGETNSSDAECTRRYLANLSKLQSACREVCFDAHRLSLGAEETALEVLREKRKKGKRTKASIGEINDQN